MELKNYFKRDAANQLNAFIQDDNLEIIKIHKNDIDKNSSPIRFVEDNEFIYGGMMYDIYKTEIKADSIYYYCINDKNENILDKSFASYVNAKTNSNTNNNAIHNILENIVKIGLTPDTSDLLIANKSTEFIIYSGEHLLKQKTETPSPPPRHAF